MGSRILDKSPGNSEFFLLRLFRTKLPFLVLFGLGISKESPSCACEKLVTKLRMKTNEKMLIYLICCIRRNLNP
jgi:hypothetical protein